MALWICSGIAGIVVCVWVWIFVDARAAKKRRAAMDAEWKKIEKYIAHGATAAEVLNHQLRGGR